MTTAAFEYEKVFEYEKEEGAKSVPPLKVLVSLNTVKYFGCQNGILCLKNRSSFGILYFSQTFLS